MESRKLHENFIESFNILINEKYGNKHGKYARFENDFANYIDDNNGTLKNNIKKWNSGTIPELPTLYSIANFFDVSIDYLLGNAKRKESYGTQYIMEQTGLSAEAILRLSEWKGKAKLPNDTAYHNTILFVSDLIECCGMQVTTLARNVFDYLYFQKILDTPNLTSKIIKTAQNRIDVAKFNASTKLIDCIRYIYANSNNVPSEKELQDRYPKTDDEKYYDDILG